MQGFWEVVWGGDGAGGLPRRGQGGLPGGGEGGQEPQLQQLQGPFLPQARLITPTLGAWGLRERERELPSRARKEYCQKSGGKACGHHGGRPTIRVAGRSTLERLLCLQVALRTPELGGPVWSLCQHPPHGPPSRGGTGSSPARLPCSPLAVVG